MKWESCSFSILGEGEGLWTHISGTIPGRKAMKGRERRAPELSSTENLALPVQAISVMSGKESPSEAFFFFF